MSIQQYKKNPAYWEYKGEPMLLIGGSDEDNPFQLPEEKLIKQLDLLSSVGGNYIRNTMSDRDEGNLYAFKKMEEAKYDLEQWNEKYWEKVEFFLQETKKRDIIVHLTLWDQHDIADHYGGWDKHPWNPENNKNLSGEKLKSPDDFHLSVKNEWTNVLYYQKKYINKLLNIAIPYDNIIYNINNESWAGPEWEDYWANYIQQKAEEKKKTVHVTTMHMRAESSARTMLDKPEIYSYTDISQNNQDAFGRSGQAHMDFLLTWRKIIHTYLDQPRPINNIKIYGGQEGKNHNAGTAIQAAERFWRNIFAGCASCRFHRPESAWGIGLSDRAQKNIKSAKLFQKEFDLFAGIPHNELLISENEGDYSSAREDNEAYCIAILGKSYAVYFPSGGTVFLDPLVYTDKMKIKWLDIDTCHLTTLKEIKVNWKEQHNAKWKGRVRLVNPRNTPRIALLQV